MIVQVYINRGNKYVRVVHSYRDPKTNKPKMKVIKNYGNLEKLLKQDKNFLVNLEKETAEKNKRLKENTLEKIKNLESEKDINEGLTRKNYGYLVYDKIWKDLKIEKWANSINTRSKINTNELLRQMVYQRLLTPSSKKYVYEHRNDYVDFESNINLGQYYKLLDIISEEKDNIEVHLNKELNKKLNRKLTIVLYDVTTYYFESVKKDDLKNFGYSKDNKVNQVQVVMGLLIDEDGIPISYEIFPGNTQEFSTMYPIVKKLKEKYNINRVIVAADRGLNSGKNLLLLKELGIDYIMAYKLKGAKKDIKNELFKDDFQTEKDFKYKTISHVKEITIDKVKYKLEDNLLLGYSEKRAKKDRADRQRLLDKAEKIVNNPSMIKQELKKGGKKYIKVTNGNLEIDLDNKQIDEAEKLDGYFAIEYSQTELTAREIRNIYSSLWKIEDSFRVLKTNLEARPIFVWSEKRIKAHFIICYIALTIERYLEKLLRNNNVSLSTSEIQNTLKNTTLGIIETLMGDYYIRDKESENFKKIIESLNMNSIPVSGFISDIKKCI